VEGNHESDDTARAAIVALTVDLSYRPGIVIRGVSCPDRKDRTHDVSHDRPFDNRELEVVVSKGRFQLSSRVTGLRDDNRDVGA
jgi:hypothetical protein